MKSVIVRKPGGPDVLEIAETPQPEAGPGQVRVKVVASSLNLIDLSARTGRLTAAGLVPPMPRYGLGWDVAGHVDAVGPGTTRFRAGDAVIGLRDLLFAGGAHAEYVVLDESALAPAPASVPLTVAATLPLNALTADRALDLVDLEPGRTLLVSGAAGSVGRFVLELAGMRGLHTIALVRPDEADGVRDLATEIVTSPDDVGAAVRRNPPDASIDARALCTGAYVALLAPPPTRGARVIVQEVLGDGNRLARLSELVDDGALTPRVTRTFPLDQARAAHELLEGGGAGGRIVLTP
ncbi:NADP-dependent oxidoreductase [Actinomadura craniellae]|uniref:NADP-dependent oxidoreductase n=1 Tax=Actinomadura craniellae TaxID=2231787 RepID=A0A365H055_9ACTN|nr:NADP-dependent oxidoreductase [Actinomadura craniellae]RAY11583.1 NADP-dependent oxidoreductase [Actinomadura craniellae]